MNVVLRDAGTAGHDRACRRLHDRVRQRVRNRGAAGRPADRPQLAAALRLRPLCRADQRQPVHRPAGHQRTQLAVSHPPHGAALGPLRARRRRAVAHRALRTRPSCRRRRCAGIRCRCRTHRPASWRAWRRSPPPATRRRIRGMAAHVYIATRSMVDEYFYNADGELLIVPQQGAPAALHRVRPHRRRARRDRRHPARREVPRRAAGRSGPRLRVRKLRRRLHPAGARPDRRQLPGQPARFHDPGGRLRGSRDALDAVREVGRGVVAGARSASRRSTWWPGTATTRPTSTTCAATRRSGRCCSTMRIPASSPC